MGIASMSVSKWPEVGAALLTGSTYHARRGELRNAFRYDVDYVLCRVHPAPWRGGKLMGRERPAFAVVRDADHGRGGSDMAAWALAQARSLGAPESALHEVWLLTQPRTLGFLFNPVSFWFFRDAAWCDARRIGGGEQHLWRSALISLLSYQISRR